MRGPFMAGCLLLCCLAAPTSGESPAPKLSRPVLPDSERAVVSSAPGALSLSAMMHRHLLARAAAEALGTGMLVQLGCAVAGTDRYIAPIDTVGSAALWGTVVALCAYATRDISGAHLNPAVTLAFCAMGKHPWAELPAFVTAQLLGATIGAGINFVLFRRAIGAFEAAHSLVRGAKGSAAVYHGAFALAPDVAAHGFPRLLLSEIASTAILMYMVFAISDPDSTIPSSAAPVLIGATVTVLGSAFGGLSGACMNPARDLGPRLVTCLAGWGREGWKAQWLYIVGPITGALLGATAYEFISASRRAALVTPMTRTAAAAAAALGVEPPTAVQHAEPSPAQEEPQAMPVEREA